MNQDKIAKFIKDVRKKSKLSQEKFGEKYGVSYQAVSKWENGKNLPDISILKEICTEYNMDINDLLDNNIVTQSKNNKNKKIIIVTAIIILIITIILSLIFIPKLQHSDSKSFQFKTIKTTCDNFELYGSIAYDKNKTSIYISNITYCGKDNKTEYKEIECNFYEVDGTTKNKIDSYKYNKDKITLDEFLKEVKFNVDHYSTTCKMYKENSLILEIKATDENNQTTLFDIPLELEENCK